MKKEADWCVLNGCEGTDNNYGSMEKHKCGQITNTHYEYKCKKTTYCYVHTIILKRFIHE